MWHLVQQIRHKGLDVYKPRFVCNERNAVIDTISGHRLLEDEVEDSTAHCTTGLLFIDLEATAAED